MYVDLPSTLVTQSVVRLTRYGAARECTGRTKRHHVEYVRVYVYSRVLCTRPVDSFLELHRILFSVYKHHSAEKSIRTKKQSNNRNELWISASLIDECASLRNVCDCDVVTHACTRIVLAFAFCEPARWSRQATGVGVLKNPARRDESWRDFLTSSPRVLEFLRRVSYGRVCGCRPAGLG